MYIYVYQQYLTTINQPKKRLHHEINKHMNIKTYVNKTTNTSNIPTDTYITERTDN